MLTPGPLSARPLPPAFSAFIRAEFHGEDILWHGPPDPRRAFWKTAPIWVFAIPWTAFALLWEGSVVGLTWFGGSATSDNMPRLMLWVFTLFGIPFVLIGLGMMAAPFWAARTARRSLQIVTDRRFARLVSGKTMALDSWPLRQVVGTRRKQRRDGSGDLTLSFGNSRDSDGDRVEKTETIADVPDLAALDRAIGDRLVHRGGAA